MKTSKQTNKQTNKLDFATLRQPGNPITQNVFDAIKVVSCLPCLMQLFLVKGNVFRNLTQLVLWKKG